MKKRGQYAVEYLVVVGFSILLLIPIIVMLTSNYIDMRYSLSSYQTYSAATEIRDAAVKVYHLGEGSMTEVAVNLPSGVESSSIANNEILFVVSAPKEMVTDSYSVVPMNISGILPSTPGRHIVKVTSNGDTVILS
jgi:hypothetical protein